MHNIITTIAALVLVGCDAKRNMQWANVKMEPVHALASDLSKARFAKYTGLTIPIQRSRKFKMAEICTAIQLYRMQFHYQNNLETFYRGF